jgi:glyoxylase-like metal-dependent hydrolase (beta-lactamase superfamily II)
VTHVAGAVYTLSGEGGNTGVSAGEDGLLLVDDEYAPMAGRPKAALAGLSDNNRMRYILNTHFHGDHIGGNQVFSPEVPTMAHTQVRQRLSTRPRFDTCYYPPVCRSGVWCAPPALGERSTTRARRPDVLPTLHPVYIQAGSTKLHPSTRSR